MGLSYKVEYKNTVVLGDNKIKFRPWTTKEEKDYLIAVESEENITNDMLFNILIRPCLEDGDVMLSSNQQKLLLIEIRKKSLGNTFPMKFHCKECKNINDVDVNFDSIVDYKESNFTDVIVDEFTFVFGEVKSENLKARLEGIESVVEYNFVNLCIHIIGIEIDGEYNDVFSFDELYDYMESLPSHIHKTVSEEFRKMIGSLKFKYKGHCVICNEENILDLEQIPNFLWE